MLAISLHMFLLGHLCLYGELKKTLFLNSLFKKKHSCYISTKECLCLPKASANRGRDIGGESVI